ncbi:MAG: DNA ligase [bacterium]
MEIQNKVVVLTGALTGMTRAEATKRLEAIGALVQDSVTKKTDIVFYGDKAGSKLAKAEKLGVAVYDESALLALLDEAAPVERVAIQTAGTAEVLQEIEDGESVEVQGSGASAYILKNVGGVYSCTCPAWRNQSVAIDKRTCKHLMAIRGEAAEAERVGGEHNVRKSAKTQSDKPQLLLAQSWEDHIDPTGWWMSEKLDGVRAYWDGSTFWSRLGNEFLAPDWFTKGLPETPLDGELWMARGAFQKTVGIVKRQDRGDLWKDIKYVVFDAPDHQGSFEERLEFLHDRLAPGVHAFAHALEHAICDGFDHLFEELKRVEALGGEGLMLRQKGSDYVRNRSATLLKVKTFSDAEAKVIGYTDGAGRHRGRIGALMLARPDGVTFKCGTGLSDDDRRNPPALGTVVTYRYQELTDGGVPRFPSYVGVRADAEWPADAVEVAEVTEAWPEENDKPASRPAKVSTKIVQPSTETEADSASDEDVQSWRCEFSEGSSNKFWEVAVSGDSHTVTYGRIGTVGQSKSKTFANAAAALADAKKQFNAKLNKGYTRV